MATNKAKTFVRNIHRSLAISNLFKKLAENYEDHFFAWAEISEWDKKKQFFFSSSDVFL